MRNGNYNKKSLLHHISPRLTNVPGIVIRIEEDIRMHVTSYDTNNARFDL